MLVLKVLMPRAGGDAMGGRLTPLPLTPIASFGPADGRGECGADVGAGSGPVVAAEGG